MTKIKTTSGFEIELDDNTLNNMEFLDAVTGLNDGDYSQFSRMAGRSSTITSACRTAVCPPTRWIVS